MTDTNADDADGQNSKLSRRTALALMGTSAVGGAAATGAFSKLTADRPVDLSVNTNDLDVSFDGTNNQLTLTNNSGSSIDATIVLDDGYTTFDDLASQTLNGATLDASNENQPAVTGISSGSSVTLNFGRFTGSSTVNFETQWDNGSDGFDVVTTKSGTVDQISRAFYSGGNDGSYNSVDKIYEYDPVNDTVLEQDVTTSGAAQSTSGVVDNKIYILGGTPDGSDPVTTIREYDPVTDSISDVSATLPNPRYRGAATTLNGKIYLVGGYNANSNATDTIYEYDPSAGTVNTKTSIQEESLRQNTVATANGLVYSLGGYNGSSNSDKIYEHDPSADTTTQLSTTLPRKRRASAGAAVNDVIYTFGGRSDGKSIDFYDTVNDNAGTKSASFSNGVAEARATAIDGKIYIFGQNDTNTIFEYDPSNDSLTEKTSLPVTISQGSAVNL